MMKVTRKRIFITGRVQGVGFRPAVYRIARDLGLTGFVYNDTKGVTVELQGSRERVETFLERLKASDKPPMADIKTCETADIATVEDENEFTITGSDSTGTALSHVTPDIATCRDCLCELADKSDFRYRYPFINCTNCGPRYSIVKTIPYDRPNTTMSVFQMCDQCASQYTNVIDRRFHAQPVACADCGPKIWLTDSGGNRIASGTDEVIAETARLLIAGKVAAIKGIGGFHLVVNALDNQAVKTLRERKKRDHKPFAMMAYSLETIGKYAIVNEAAKKVLTGCESPIVLLDKRTEAKIAPLVAEGVSSFAFMLCYAPLHHMLFEKLRQSGVDALVMTSGNISDEPLICKNDLALERLGSIADAFLMHDRQIHRQVDDSIVHFIDGQPVLLRRARGYVPTPVLFEHGSAQDIFAAGGDLKNTFCFVKQNQLICSEHIGDLEDAEVYHHYVDSIEHFRGLFEVKPQTIVCDLHPGYFSTQYALSVPNVRVVQVQHHWAHIASVLAEYNLTGPVIGLECDGTGYGTDGAIWGCECMIASLEKFERFGHLAYYPLAGGDLAGKEAIRPTLSLLMQAYGDEFALERFGWLLDRIEPDKAKQKIIAEQIVKNINVVQTSSLGRVFDAVAAIAGLGSYNHFEAQLPMALEAAVDKNIERAYGFELTKVDDEPVQIDLRRMFVELVDDIAQHRPVGEIAARFHNCLAEALVAMAKRAAEAAKMNTVALSGGVFCNRYLANEVIKLLKAEGFSVLFNRHFPSNDGGIALGQAAIAAMAKVNE